MTLYKTDFYAWTLQQAEHLRAEAMEQLDIQNLIEEIEGMSSSERRQLSNRLHVLLMHLLKLLCQKHENPKRWLATIREQRRRIGYLLKDSPSLRNLLDERIADVYPDARDEAAEETGLLLDTFPAICPWTTAQIMDNHFYP